MKTKILNKFDMVQDLFALIENNIEDIDEQGDNLEDIYNALDAAEGLFDDILSAMEEE